MTDPEQLDLIAGLADELDPLMRRMLAAEELAQVQDCAGEVKWRCLQAPYFEHLWGAGALYVVWSELDDIIDGWHIDYGSAAGGVALREFRRAATEWLDMPRTGAGISDYTQRWKARIAAHFLD